MSSTSAENSLAALRLRSRLLQETRGFFVGAGFIEVETPILVRSPGLEVHLRAVTAGDRYLITSPEYHMKRLLARGSGPIFQLVRCFREDEMGPEHAREFTMLEWYRPAATYEALMCDLEGLFEHLRPPRSDLRPPFERLKVEEAFARYARMDPHELDETGFFRTLLDDIEPKLGKQRPTILHEWPAAYAALARIKPEDPRVALRFELFAGGLELCNAFDELTDPVEQRRRFELELAERARTGLEAYPLDEEFLKDLADMPPSAGAALGFDRLVMLWAGASDIRQVTAFSESDA